LKTPFSNSVHRWQTITSHDIEGSSRAVEETTGVATAVLRHVGTLGKTFSSNFEIFARTKSQMSNALPRPIVKPLQKRETRFDVLELRSK
jgi:hypothetical protein